MFKYALQIVALFFFFTQPIVAKDTTSPRGPAAEYVNKVFGSVGYGEVLRTWDDTFKTLCYSASGRGDGTGVGIACFQRDDLKLEAGTKKVFESLGYGELTRVWDEQTKVVCFIITGRGDGTGSAISCQRK